MANRIFNPTNGTITLPAPYGQILTPGSGIITADSEADIITALGGLENFVRSGLLIDAAPSGSAITPATGAAVGYGTAGTFTALQKFTTLMLAVWNAGATFVTKFATNATANRTVTFPDADATMAQAGVATAAGGTGASGATAPAFTGTAPTSAVNLSSPAFTGTGMTAAGQVMTSTDNQTMTLNQCAGMWLVCAEHGPYLIASNTAVSGAPAVLTIYGTAPTTDAGTYKILAAPTPAGSVASHTHTGPSHTHTQV